MEGWIMGDIRTSGLGGVPFGNNSGRPANVTGQPYFNGETARLELYTTSGSWENIVQEVPAVTSITGNYSELTDSGIISIFGTNFVTGAIAAAIGTNGVVVNAASTTFNSLVELTATFTGLSNAYEPYDIRVTNPSNLFGIMPDSLYVNASPVWVTSSGSLGTFNEQVSITLSALSTTDSDSTVTYAVASGSSLPSGVTLNSSTGVISGTLPDISSDTTYTFTINATDGLNIIPRTFTITSKYLIPVEYLVVAGGGGGSSIIGGGGGAGGVLSGTVGTLPSVGLTVTVGNGGRGATGYQGGINEEAGYPGYNSVFNSITATGGGGTLGWDTHTLPVLSGNQAWRRDGGSGGGGTGGGNSIDGLGANVTGGTGVSGQGYAGGTGSDPYGAGGGGAGGIGHTQSIHGNIDGGNGVSNSITGSAVTYGGGGGGGRRRSGGGQGPSSGGTGGGGAGGSGANAATSGTANTGGGGGGGNYEGPSPSSQAGGNGGSGVVIIAYPNTYAALTSIGAGLTYDQPTRSGYRVYRFTAGSGTITI
jgi:hypothetical protein